MSQKTVIKSNLVNNITSNLIKFWQISVIFLFLQIVFGTIEVLWLGNIHGLTPENQLDVLFINLLNTIKWGLYTLGFFLILYGTIGMALPKTSLYLYKLVLSLLLLWQVGLIAYFSKTLVPLGADLFTYSFEDIIETVRAAGALNGYSLIAFLLVTATFYFLLGLGKFIQFGQKSIFYISVTAYVVLAGLFIVPEAKPSNLTSLENNLSINKSLYFYEETYNYYSAYQNIYFDFYLATNGDKNALVNKNYVDPSYPFLHVNEYPDLLSPFFHEFDSVPDLVFLIVEGLGKAYSGHNAYLGSWTPFLDSLATKSLYWENTLSTTGRTFGLLPGLFASLPFGQSGFMEETPYPRHNSMLRILNENGYQTNYFIGTDSKFDNASQFLRQQGINLLVDIDDFDPDFEKSPSVTGFSWGYADKETFANGIRKLPESEGPQINIFQTISSHSPFIVPDQVYYDQKFHRLLTKMGGHKSGLDLKNYQKELASILYVDDAIKEFFEAYMRLPKAQNTIFVITGDHRLPEIPMSTKIDRFHVPLILYSPKLKRSKSMKAVNTHLEVTPSMLAFLEKNYSINLPDTVAWRGSVLDTAAEFQSHISHALMRNKYQFGDYIDGEYFISDDQLFKVMDKLYIEPITDQVKYDQLRSSFEDYKGKDAYVVKNNAILPN